MSPWIDVVSVAPAGKPPDPSHGPVTGALPEGAAVGVAAVVVGGDPVVAVVGAAVVGAAVVGATVVGAAVVGAVVGPAAVGAVVLASAALVGGADVVGAVLDDVAAHPAATSAANPTRVARERHHRCLGTARSVRRRSRRASSRSGRRRGITGRAPRYRVPMAGSILGTRVLRTEDPELLFGVGAYVSDLPLVAPLHVAFVRSEMAHARIVGIDTSAAVASPGVVAVWTAAELGVAPHHGMVKVHNDFARAPLATDRVRFVGDGIVAVFAESSTAARDAAELVIVDYEPLPAVVSPEEALGEDAPLLFEAHGNNIAISSTDPHNPDIFAEADVVVRGRYVNQRIAVAPMEPHAAAAEVGDDGRLTMYGSTQMPHLLQSQLAAALGLPLSQVHVITPHVGGGFGGKAGIYPEQTIVAKAAMDLGRPVLWTATRSEDMCTLSHSRAQIQYVELGCKRDGTFTGLRVRLVGDAGAYPGVGAFLPAGTRRMSNGTYRFPAIQFDVAVALTNTTPTGAYRGAGRPEATALLERAVDHAALVLGMDPIELRRMNLLTDDVFPFTTLTGVTYDSGRYSFPLDEAARFAGYEELRAEQTARRKAGDRMLLGIGVSAYVEITAGGGASEYGSVAIHDDGSATVMAGTSAHGQGHQTAFSMILSSRTGIPIERIRLVQSDTDLVRSGGGTGGSRSLQLGGSAVLQATEAMVDKARHLAANLLEANVDDIVVDTETGTVGVAGVPASALDWATLAAAAATAPEGVIDTADGALGLAAQLDFDQGEATFPFGAHIAVVEVDSETGKVTLLRHVAVDDCGTVLNPLLVEGQQHGGVAAGISQALYEQIAFDEIGNPITGNFADYAIPSAAEFPFFEVHSTETPTPLNPLGAKGIGEASTIGSTPAVQNAVIDALSHLGVRHLDLPCTSESVWQAIADAATGALRDPWREPPAIFAKLAEGQKVDEAGLNAAEGI
ncbi:MAG: putative carbon monoxide dehydrogenase large subunit [Ilumatobacteraceae bacterium]|nr:putative carbon monoxide dehydrogenase large subunit [Ilumatobacteraceae bacterium]